MNTTTDRCRPGGVAIPFAAGALGAALLVAAPATRAQGLQLEPGGSNTWAITPELEKAVEAGHRFLASRQHARGYWSQDVGFKLNTDYRITKGDAPHIGVSALALMSFLAGGHVPGRGPYGDNVSRGLDYILSQVQEIGYITDQGSRMYSHAFATLFLAEVYGMTRRADVRAALQKAVNLIVDSQNGQGGWRYKPFARESDMSITVCQVVALRAARNVGITVPTSTIRQAESYVRRSAVRDAMDRPRFHYRGGLMMEGGAFRYQIGQASRATFPLTAAGVTTLYAAGIYDDDDETIRRAFRYMNDQMDRFNRTYGGHYFFYYGHYYAVQAYYVAGGQDWKSYFRTIRRELLQTRNRDGSWPCETGPGEAFSTAIATLILQIPYQYLPIFQR